ncbi:hypothetical protein BH10CYA1_BH10CYA1_18560 [soil metagenome]
MATNTGLPLGRALVLSNLISQQNLEAALRLQTIYRNSKIPLSVAVDAYLYCARDGITPEQAVAKAGFKGQIISYSKLGTLLVDAKLISKTQLDEAQKTSYQTGMQLGKMLCFNGAITEAMLSAALELQSKLRNQLINKDQALAELSTMFAQQVMANAQMQLKESANDEPLKNAHVEHKIKLGEFLLMSGVITEIDVMDALELSLSQNKTMTEVFVETAVVPSSLIGIAMELQTAVNLGHVTIESACESLHFIARTGERPISSGAAAEADTSIQLGDLLQMADYVQARDIETAAVSVKSFPSLIGKLLVVNGFIDEPTMRAALRCQSLLRQNELSGDEAIKALKLSGQRQISFDDAVEELGFPKGNR